MSVDVETKPEPVLTAYDVIGIGFSVFGLLLATATVIAIQPTYVAMFRDFGDAQLPHLTLICLRPWFPFIFAGMGPLLITSAAVARLPAATRAAFLLATIAALLIGAGVFLYGMYLPLFAIADSIK